jgi:hypothetical protein
MAASALAAFAEDVRAHAAGRACLGARGRPRAVPPLEPARPGQGLL